MFKIYFHLQSWLSSQSGATAIEYGLIAAGIGLAVSIAIFAFGDGLNTIFGDAATQVSSRP